MAQTIRGVSSLADGENLPREWPEDAHQGEGNAEEDQRVTNAPTEPSQGVMHNGAANVARGWVDSARKRLWNLETREEVVKKMEVANQVVFDSLQFLPKLPEAPQKPPFDRHCVQDRLRIKYVELVVQLVTIGLMVYIMFSGMAETRARFQ